MKSFKIIGYSQDLRTKSYVIYAQIQIPDYLSFVGDNFDEFDIQRKRENHKGYDRLKKDIKNGALIPPITLALKPDLVSRFLPFVRTEQSAKLEKEIEARASVYILDGLQRTHIMTDLQEEGVKFKDSQKLLVEFWFEPDMGNLVYRLIVLNSGQKPMSMRHQIELLFMTMQDKLKTDIPGLVMFNERDKATRDKANMFPFERIVTGYHCFIEESPEIDKGRIIKEKLASGKVVTDHELVILDRYSEYTKYLTVYLKIDAESYRIYEKFREFSSAKNWLAEENVVDAFFAAIGLHSQIPEFKKRVDSALQKLLKELKAAKVGTDPLGLKEFDIIRKRFDPKQFNVGFITRKTMMDCFSEYLRGEGLISLARCWELNDPAGLKSNMK